MATKRRPYVEGDWLVVPLGAGMKAIGRIARAGARGGMLVYFFGPARPATPARRELDDLKANHAVLVCICGDLGVLRREWEVISGDDGWRESDWPIPAFGRCEEGTDRFYQVQYESDLSTEGSLTAISAGECSRLPRDGVLGYRLVEKRLARQLGVG